MMIKNKLLASVLKMRKTFDSPLANHFSPFTQALKTMKRLTDELIPECAENRNTLQETGANQSVILIKTLTW
jgi:hypothetical protein